MCVSLRSRGAARPLSLAPLGGVPVSKTDIMSSRSRAAAAEEAKRERGSFQCAITIITACEYNTTDPTLTDGDSHSCLIAQDGPEGRRDAVKVGERDAEWPYKAGQY